MDNVVRQECLIAGPAWVQRSLKIMATGKAHKHTHVSIAICCNSQAVPAIMLLLHAWQNVSIALNGSPKMIFKLNLPL